MRRPKHLALLAYLAIQNGQLCRRDTLLALFWPESDEAHARNALSKMLSRIRRELGDHGICTEGAHLVGAESSVVRIDVCDFRSALELGDWARALDLYGGDFLHGFHLTGSPGFERWADELRGQLRTEALDAASRLADRAESAGDVPAAVAALRRALAMAPMDEALVRHLMMVLHEHGARSAALTTYRALEEELRRELQTTPMDETRAVAAQIQGSSPIRSLAVLPWVNLTGSPEQEHICDGFLDILITELATTSIGRIISRQSSLGLKGSSLAPREAGELLNVEAVVDGSVVRYGERVIVTARLLQVKPEEHLWAERFESDIGELPEVASAISRSVCERLWRGRAPDLPLVRPPHAPIDASAYEAYLRGRHFSGMLPQLGKAIECYREAIDRAPEYAPAWAGLASALGLLTMLAHISPAQAFPALRQAAERALQLDDRLGEAHTSLGLYRMLAERDWRGADEAFQRGAERASGAAEPHTFRAVYLAAMGRSEEANAGVKRALEMDPIGAGSLFCRAWCAYKTAEHAQSIRQLRGMLELHPHFGLAFAYLGVNHALLGEADDALEAAVRSMNALPDNHEALALGIAVLGRCGRATEARKTLARLLALGEDRYLDPWAVAIAYTGLGKFDEALRWFGRMYDERSPSAFCIARDPLLEPLREDPRFRDILRRLAFPSVGAAASP
ncbi:MAG TPA: BTAD domain-containing putative transcriptional regulator [Gemmatimonadaceae bacterium]|nr:BTAD domain-containing putative transcriptional regulator [Gemmatimonadaceae bacterium]